MLICRISYMLLTRCPVLLECSIICICFLWRERTRHTCISGYTSWSLLTYRIPPVQSMLMRSKRQYTYFRFQKYERCCCATIPNRRIRDQWHSMINENILNKCRKEDKTKPDKKLTMINYTQIYGQ